MTRATALQDATREANSEHVMGWWLCGFFLGIFGPMIAYLRSPHAPAEALAKYDDPLEIQLFETKYVGILKARQVRATWLGLILAVLMAGLAFCSLMVAGMASAGL